MRAQEPAAPELEVSDTDLQSARNQETTAGDIILIEPSRPPLRPNFSLNITLTARESRLFERFRYLYEAAAEDLGEAPPLPLGLQTFLRESIQLHYDSTPPSHKRTMLLQLLCSGVCLQSLLIGTPVGELPPTKPDWADLSFDEAPRSFLCQLADFVRGRNMIVVLASATPQDLLGLSDQLRSRQVNCKFFMEPPSWERLDTPGVLLVTATEMPLGKRKRLYDGVLLPPGVEPWPGIICGSSIVKSHSSICLRGRCRTALIDEHLPALIER